MKQEKLPAAKPDWRVDANSPSANAVSRLRTTPKGKEPPRLDHANPPERAKSVPPDAKDNSKVKRSLLLGRPTKSGEIAAGSHKCKEEEENKAPGLGRGAGRAVVEQFARLRRVRGGGSGGVDEKKKCDELQEKVEASEGVIKSLQGEVLGLKEELEEARRSNEELRLRNREISEGLAVAEAKVAALGSPDQIRMLVKSAEEYRRPKFKDVQKLIANKLESPRSRKDTSNGSSLPARAAAQLIPGQKDNDLIKSSPASTSLPPPPPPPPMSASRPRAKGSATTKASAVVEYYQFLMKQEGKASQPRIGSSNASVPASVHSSIVGEIQNRSAQEGKASQPRIGSSNASVPASAHSSIVGEIQNRSAHLLAIRADIETKGEFINGLIRKLQSAAYSDIEDVVEFVDWVDIQLTSLADERAVLKHFDWPEKKADAMREASVEYRSLKLLEEEIALFKDDHDFPCEIAMKKMANLLDKSEKGIQKLVILRSSVMRTYQDFKIPTGWMLDSGMVNSIKQASRKLANTYLKRVRTEFESVRRSDRESTQEALLLQGVHFAYRAHQFAGGLDSEALRVFEEIRQRVPGNLQGSHESLAGILST